MIISVLGLGIIGSAVVMGDDSQLAQLFQNLIGNAS
jgi:signal transduction histidine kinase